MLKSIVNGAEHDIVSIPMRGRNLWNPDSRTNNQVGQLNWGVVLPAGVYTIVNNSNTSVYQRDGVDSTQATTFAAAGTTKTVRFNNALVAWTSSKQTQIMLNIGTEPLPYEPYGYQNGWEVRDNQNRIIWGREDELQTTTGTLPFKGYDLPVKVKSLLGNGVQNGTPSPDNVVVPEFCGVRTRNLYVFPYISTLSASGTGQNRIVSNTQITKSSVFSIEPNTTYTVSGNRTDAQDVFGRLFLFSEKPEIGSVSTHFYSFSKNSSVTFTTDLTEKWCLVQADNSSSSELTNDYHMMLNTGSTALSYEPYGYKITFDNNGENLLNLNRTYSNSFTTDTTKWMNGAATVNNAGTVYAETEILGDVIKVTSKNPGYGASFLIEASPNTTYTVSFETDKDSSGSWGGISDRDIDGTVIHQEAIQGKSTTFTTSDNCAFLNVCFRFPPADGTVTFSNIMVNIGSTPLPYSPYLNKTTPIYLGEVPTIRRIKKLVLDGTEGWYLYSTGTIHQFYTHDLAIGGMTLSSAFSTIAPYGMIANNRVGDYGCYTVTNGTEIAFQMYGAKDTLPNVAAWKTYLSTQYQNGTPVTVWYVLSEPETGIVNEPLAKIGDYADELTNIQVHGLSAPLYGIEDYKDILNLATGVFTGKIKKLVLTSAMINWTYDSTYSRYTFRIADSLVIGVRLTPVACSHFIPIYDGRSIGDVPNNAIYSNSQGTTNNWFIKTTDYTTSSSFGQFLDDELAAGRPVTVWYVINTPETETVTVPTGMTGEIEGYLKQISTPTPEHPSIPKWNGKEETGGTYAVTVYNLPEIPTTTGQNKLTVDTTLKPYNVTINGHIKYTYWGKIREDVRSGLAQTKFPVGTILYDNEDATTGRAFQVVGHDKHFDPSLTARGFTHSMTLCQLKLSGPWQFDATEAFLYTTVEMQPRTYKFKIPNYDTTYGGNKTYYFTSTATVPVDSQIVLKWDYQKPPASVTAYAGPNPQTKTTAITGFNSLQLSEWIEGESPEAIDLGTIKLANNDPDSAYGKLNHIHRARYGSNNYYQSGLRQLLNTDIASNNWWHPTTIFDRPYGNRTTNGYLRSLNEDFINVLATPEITHIANNIFEYPSLDGKTFALNTEYKINTDKVFLLSHTEVGLSSSPNVGTVLDYYSTHNTNSDRIKYRIDNGNAYYWWFRTPYPTYADLFHYCLTSGALSGDYANYALGVAPAYIIQ